MPVFSWAHVAQLGQVFFSSDFLEVERPFLCSSKYVDLLVFCEDAMQKANIWLVRYILAPTLEAQTAVHTMAVVHVIGLLFIHCLFVCLLGACFVVWYLVPFLVKLSCCLGKEGWLLYFNNVRLSAFCVSSSQTVI